MRARPVGDQGTSDTAWTWPRRLSRGKVPASKAAAASVRKVVRSASSIMRQWSITAVAAHAPSPHARDETVRVFGFRPLPAPLRHYQRISKSSSSTQAGRRSPPQSTQMFAASLAPLGLLHQPAALRTVANARARPAVALLNELWTPDALPAISALPPGFESLMPHAAAEHHTPFSRHLFNAILAYVALDTSCFAFRLVKKRMAPDAQHAARLASAPTTKFGCGSRNQTRRADLGQKRSPPLPPRVPDGCKPTCEARCLRLRILIAFGWACVVTIRSTCAATTRPRSSRRSSAAWTLPSTTVRPIA